MSRSQAPVRDLVLLSDKALAGLRTHLERHGQAWHQAWCQWAAESAPVSGFDLTVQRVADACEALPDPAGWQAVDGVVGLWRHAGEDAVQALAKLLVRRANGSFASDVEWAFGAARAALTDLQARWCAGEVAQPASSGATHGPLDDALHAALGGVLVSLPALGAHWLLSPACYRSWQPANDKKAMQPIPLVAGPWTEVLSPHALSLALGIGHVDIAVTDLLELRVGDVVRFPALLKEPLPLAAVKADGQPEELMRGRLGHRDGRLAVEVVSRSRPV